MTYARPPGDPPRTEAELDERLSRPTETDVAALDRLDGDLLVLGAGGKMGPSLARLARRATKDSDLPRRIIAVSRFTTPGLQKALMADGIETVACDLLEPGALERLPDLPNVVFMAGQKFGTSADPAATWTLNALLPGLVARRFASSRLVVFSTGNVYPLVTADSRGHTEAGPLQPIGEYAQSALARERIVTFLSTRHESPAAILRLNYAVELRYGVLRDLADRVWRREAVDLSMGYVNVIWQRDANAVALRSLSLCSVPPTVLNVTGTEKLAVRALAIRLGQCLGVVPRFVGEEAPTALLSDASRCEALFGPPTVGIDTLIHWVADWVKRGGPTLGKPTHFEERDGRF